MSKWRTMKSAPKDGSLIIVHGEGYYAVACWGLVDAFQPGGEIWGWKSQDDFQKTYPEPTHWLPLPKLPKTK